MLKIIFGLYGMDISVFGSVDDLGFNLHFGPIMACQDYMGIKYIHKIAIIHPI